MDSSSDAAIEIAADFFSENCTLTVEVFDATTGKALKRLPAAESYATAEKFRDHSVSVNFGACVYTAAFSRLGGGMYSIAHRWTFSQSGIWKLQAGISFPLTDAQPFAPAVLYRNNDRGEGCFLKADMDSGFSLREDRTPLPGCMVVYNNRQAVCACLSQPEENESANFSVFVSQKKGRVTTGLQQPAQERPFSYQGKTRQIVDYEEAPLITTASGADSDGHTPDGKFSQTLSRVQYFYLCDISHTKAETGMLAAYRNFMTTLDADGLLPHVPAAQNEEITDQWENWRKLKLFHLYSLLEKNAHGAYIKMGKGNGDLQHIYEFTGASFLVKSLEAAVIFARSGDTKTAESIGRFFLQAEQPANSGIFRDNHNLTTGEWGGYLGIAEDQSYKYLVNARCNGEAMLSYIRLYEILREKGLTCPEFIELPKRVARFYLDCQIRGGEFDGCFGRWWTADGKSKNMLGTNGVYIGLFFLRLARHAGETMAAELSAAVKKAAAYYLKLTDNADFYGDTLDADAYDKESAAVLLRLWLDLFEVTGEERFKTAAIKAADFAITWIWLYNVIFPAGTPLEKEHFKTVGMTSVSTAHHHLDFYGMYLARDFLRLEQVTGLKLYGKLARDMQNACLQLVCNEDRNLGKSPDFAGWQPEQINYTAWDYFDRPDWQKGHYDICIAWVPVLTLGAYYMIRDESPEQKNAIK